MSDEFLDEADLTENEKAAEFGETETKTVDLYVAQKGLSERSGGPYLDDVEREEAEKRRAKVEGREPDLDNPPATAGTLLVTKDKLVETDNSRAFTGTELTAEPHVTVEAEIPVPGEPDSRQRD